MWNRQVHVNRMEWCFSHQISVFLNFFDHSINHLKNSMEFEFAMELINRKLIRSSKQLIEFVFFYRRVYMEGRQLVWNIYIDIYQVDLIFLLLSILNSSLYREHFILLYMYNWTGKSVIFMFLSSYTMHDCHSAQQFFLLNTELGFLYTGTFGLSGFLQISCKKFIVILIVIFQNNVQGCNHNSNFKTVLLIL